MSVSQIDRSYKENKLIKEYELENPYIMFALEYENQKKYFEAAKLYKKLYEETNNYEYLLRFITLNHQFQSYKAIDNIIDDKVLNEIVGLKEEEQILRFYAYSLLKVNKKDESLKIANRLINEYTNEINYELLGSIYLDLKEYKKSYNMFNKSFEINNSANALMTLTNIQYFYLLDNENAKHTIEEYFKKEKTYNYNLFLQLLTFYEKDKNESKALNLLENVINFYKEQNNKIVVENTQKLYIRYLAMHDIHKAIKYVKENVQNDEILLNLYRSAKQTNNAYILLNKMYSKTNNLDYLAQIAIIEFEKSDDKLTVLNSVIVKFEKVLEKLSNPVYENYLAYLLIDFDKDYKKGLILVNKALKKEPENIAYIDTLAWGEYKINNCSKAYALMKKVVDKVGLEDNEIKLHWEKIQECYK